MNLSSSEKGTSSPLFYRAAVCVGLLFLTAFFALGVFNARFFDWNAIRLAPAAAVGRGLPIYPSENAGVITGHIYPPLDAWAYVPVTWLSDVSAMMSAGSLLALVFFSLPFGWLAVKMVRGGQVSLVDGAGVMIAVLLATAWDPALRYASLSVHTEAPAIGLIGLAIMLAAATRVSHSWRWGVVGALAVAAILCKQTLLPAWFALGLVVALWQGRAAAWRFVVGSGVVTAVFALWLVFFGDGKDFYYNTVWLPGHHPWKTQGYDKNFVVGVPALAQGMGDRIRVLGKSFWWTHWWWPVFAVAGWWSRRRFRTKNQRSGLPWFVTILAAAVAVAEFPMAMAGFAKVGGDVNVFAPLLAPVLLLLMALVLDIFSEAPGPRLVQCRVVLAVMLTAMMGVNAPRLISSVQEATKRPEANRPMVNYLRQHPGEVYLPWDPLPAWVAEGRRDHFDYGVFDRALAERPLTPEHYFAHLPPRLRWVAVQRGRGVEKRTKMARHYLAHFQEIPSPSGLEEWVFYETSRP